MKRFRWIIIVGALIAAWIVVECLLYRRTVPPANVTDINSFLMWRPSTEPFVVLASDHEHLMVVGATSGLLPSGSSAYVFDRSGKLVDWSADIGDDPKFDGKWQAQHSLGNGKSIPIGELSSWLIPGTRPAR